MRSCTAFVLFDVMRAVPCFEQTHPRAARRARAGGGCGGPAELSGRNKKLVLLRGPMGGSPQGERNKIRFLMRPGGAKRVLCTARDDAGGPDATAMRNAPAGRAAELGTWQVLVPWATGRPGAPSGRSSAGDARARYLIIGHYAVRWEYARRTVFFF